MAGHANSPASQCLIVERHAWETGGTRQQLQIPAPACAFFGAGSDRINLTLNVFVNPRQVQITVSRNAFLSQRYPASGVRRINGLPEMGGIPGSFIFFQKTETPNDYNLWYLEDKAIVVAFFRDSAWRQAPNSQHGRGRLWTTVDSSAPRWITRTLEL